jgi:site-specific DNA recombinase
MKRQWRIPLSPRPRYPRRWIMNVAVYVRVSTQHQAQAQTIEQQLDRLRAHIQQQGWELRDEHIFRDDGYSGAALNRPGQDRLRDRVRLGEVDRVLLTAPDRLARKYVHQVLLLEELERAGCQVEFLDRPMSQDPPAQLLLQIRGAVAEYERALIAERMRRGWQAKLRAGLLLPWTKPPDGYRVNPECPRDPTGVRLEEAEAAVVRELFAWYLEEPTSLYALVKRLMDHRVPAPNGKMRWNVSAVRGILTNPAYTGQVYSGRQRARPARVRHSATHPIGHPCNGRCAVPPEEWILVTTIPAIVSPEEFGRVQDKLAHNQQFARRNNTAPTYLLRGLVSCGVCQLACFARTLSPGYDYYICRGKLHPILSCRDEKCAAPGRWYLCRPPGSHTPARSSRSGRPRR